MNRKTTKKQKQPVSAVPAKRSVDLCDIEIFDPQRVAQARSRMLPDEHVENLSSTFQCLGHPTRVKMVQALLGGELCVCDLAQVLGTTVSAVSHQLRTLRSLHLVKFRKAGKMAYYSIDDEHVRTLFALGLEHVRHEP